MGRVEGGGFPDRVELVVISPAGELFIGVGVLCISACMLFFSATVVILPGSVGWVIDVWDGTIGGVAILALVVILCPCVSKGGHDTVAGALSPIGILLTLNSIECFAADLILSYLIFVDFSVAMKSSCVNPAGSNVTPSCLIVLSVAHFLIDILLAISSLNLNLRIIFRL